MSKEGTRCSFRTPRHLQEHYPEHLTEHHFDTILSSVKAIKHWPMIYQSLLDKCRKG